MNKSDIPDQVRQKSYASAAVAIADSLKGNASEQSQSPSYKLAFADNEFLLRDEMRGIRLQVEYEKPDLLLKLQGIESIIVIFGGARIREEREARKLLQKAKDALAEAPSDPLLQREAAIAERIVASAKFYEEAREVARLASTACLQTDQCHFVVATGGGPGIMEAANRGANDAGAKSIGLNIVLPHEQEPNPFITPDLCFQFHYFALRKMHFLMRAKALICFPGGFGTMDELFDALTLIQTGKMGPIPVLLFGSDYWSKAINFDFLLSEGLIKEEDKRIFHTVDSAQEAWAHICEFYSFKME